MTPRHVRALRGGIAAWIATVVAATAHTLAGGGAPSPALVAGIGILATPVAVALIGRRLAAWRIAAAVLLAQAFFHVAFAVTAGADPSVAATVHTHHVLSVASPLAPGLVGTDGPMLAAHVLAAIATVVALVSGERMLRALGRGIRSMFSRLDAVTPPASSAPRVGTMPPPTTHVAGRLVLSDLSRRGPPRSVAATF